MSAVILAHQHENLSIHNQHNLRLTQSRDVRGLWGTRKSPQLVTCRLGIQHTVSPLFKLLKDSMRGQYK